jgi:hypothetical protein
MSAKTGPRWAPAAKPDFHVGFVPTSATITSLIKQQSSNFPNRTGDGSDGLDGFFFNPALRREERMDASAPQRKGTAEAEPFRDLVRNGG